MKTFTLIFTLTIALSANLTAQETVKPVSGSLVSDPDTVSAQLRTEAVEFLRSTAADVNNMRTLENRISFSAEIAGLMWFNDEREARAMYQAVINDFRQLLARLDYELNSAGVGTDKSAAGMFPPSARSKLSRKFAKSIVVRQQITSSLAEHDPKLALEFYTETGEAISNPEMRERSAQQDLYFETRLLQQIALKDSETALKFARRNLAKGINYETVNLLRNLYEIDAEKGISFGEDVVSKLKSDDSKADELYIVSALINLGEDSIENGKRAGSEKRKPPIFSDQNMRAIAEIMAQAILGSDKGYDYSGYLTPIEKYAPSRALQIRTKFGIKKTAAAPAGSPTVEAVTDKVETTPAPVEDAGSQMSENIEKLKQAGLTAEDRQKVIERSRAIIESLEDPNAKIMALSALASQIAQLGEKQLASGILEDARRLVNPQPVNYRDFMESWALAGGYANVDPDKAFPVLESTIYRLNDTITAFVKVGEFMDIEGDMIEDGEIQLGSFGGGFTRELVGVTGVAGPVVKKLALADLKRTKDLTNRFDRQELRILAKMLVLRALLDTGNSKPDEELSGF